MTGPISVQLDSAFSDESASSSTEMDAAEIRRRMSAIRDDIKGDVEGIVQNAQELADWKHYVRSFPWGSLAVAVATGYLAVPRRLEVLSPDADQIAKLANQDRLVVSNKPSTEARSGLASTVLKLAGTAALRAAVGYATAKVGSTIAKQAMNEEASE